jgi:hypothetical protein
MTVCNVIGRGNFKVLQFIYRVCVYRDYVLFGSKFLIFTFELHKNSLISRITNTLTKLLSNTAEIALCVCVFVFHFMAPQFEILRPICNYN